MKPCQKKHAITAGLTGKSEACFGQMSKQMRHNCRVNGLGRDEEERTGMDARSAPAHGAQAGPARPTRGGPARRMRLAWKAEALR